MTNVEALKKLYTDLGGSAAEVEGCTTVSEVIPKLSEVAGGGGGGIDVYRIEKVYDEETDEVSYIADVPFFEVEKTPAFAILYETENGEVSKEYGYMHVGNWKFNEFQFDAGSSPNLSINVLYPAIDDETGRVFIKENSVANITILD